MDIVEALKKHHDEIRTLFKKTKDDPGNFEQLKKNLEVHHTNEENFLLNNNCIHAI